MLVSDYRMSYAVLEEAWLFITLLRISVGDRCAKTRITGLGAILSDLR